MFKSLISAALVFRLQMREPSVDWGAAFLACLYRPAIEITLPREAAQHSQRDEVRVLVDNLNSVYPF